QDVRTNTASHLVALVATDQTIAARATRAEAEDTTAEGKDGFAGPPVHVAGVPAGEQLVLTMAAASSVRSVFSAHNIVAIKAPDEVMPVCSDQHVSVVGAIDHVG